MTLNCLDFLLYKRLHVNSSVGCSASVMWRQLGQCDIPCTWWWICRISLTTHPLLHERSLIQFSWKQIDASSNLSAGHQQMLFTPISLQHKERKKICCCSWKYTEGFCCLPLHSAGASQPGQSVLSCCSPALGHLVGMCRTSLVNTSICIALQDSVIKWSVLSLSSVKPFILCRRLVKWNSHPRRL